MKIGILTFHRSYNYGAFMQCFSLVNRLKKDFQNVEFEVIDYTAEKIMKQYEHELDAMNTEGIKAQFRKRQELFHECQKKLPLSKKKIVSDSMDEIAEYLNETYDAVIVGSDAVWNWKVRGFPNLYFLKDYIGKKFSYAASVHGMSYQNITEEQKEYLKEAFSDFEYIGARDITTEKMVEFCESEVKACHNCDPTAFLDLNDVQCSVDYLKKKFTDAGIDFNKPVIGIMASDRIGREIKRHYKNKVQLVALFQPNKYADFSFYDLSPFEWARTFSLFDVTLTHFFHGTMLSLVNGTPVIPVEAASDFSDRNTTKIKDVMGRLGLSDWRFEDEFRNRTFIQKVLYKLGLYTNKKMWKSVCEKIDDCLMNDYSALIRERLTKEAESYSSFYEVLKRYTK